MTEDLLESRPATTGLLQRTVKLCTRLAGALLFLMMIHVCVDVVARIFKLPLLATNETVAAYYMIAIVFLPLGYVALIGANITVDLFATFQGRRMRFASAILAEVIGLAVALLWLRQATLTAIHSTEITERWIIGSTFLQIWPGRWILVLSLLLLSLIFLRGLWRTIRLGENSSAHRKDEISAEEAAF